MKRSSFILTVSLAVNAGLAVVFFAGGERPVEGKPTATKSPSAMMQTRDSSAETPSQIAHATPWQTLNPSKDLSVLVSRLRTAGFPDTVVRAIITALVNERTQAERARIENVAMHTPFWKMRPNSFLDPETGPALRKLFRDSQAEIKGLLGDTDDQRYAATEEGKAMRQQDIGDIPTEKLGQLFKYFGDYQEKRAQIFSALGRGRAMLPSDRENIVALDKGMREGLAEFLTPHEVNEYLLRNSDAAQQLKWALGAVRPSESEFRTIFPLFQSYADQFPASTFRAEPNAPVDAARKMAEESMIAQLGAVLGQQKAEEVRLALDPKYSRVNQLVARLELPIAASKQVYDVQQDIQSRAAAVRGDRALSEGGRASQLAALAEEASTKISSALGGPRGLEAYKQYGGEWIGGLAPKG